MLEVRVPTKIILLRALTKPLCFVFSYLAFQPLPNPYDLVLSYLAYRFKSKNELSPNPYDLAFYFFGL